MDINVYIDIDKDETIIRGNHCDVGPLPDPSPKCHQLQKRKFAARDAWPAIYNFVGPTLRQSPLPAHIHIVAMHTTETPHDHLTGRQSLGPTQFPCTLCTFAWRPLRRRSHPAILPWGY
ncbi:hypothetical protein LIA77_00347 [Sarocladium implicatum]|nr:hypothetical protein LIA77_00347 [Sarocladium implicatum]